MITIQIVKSKNSARYLFCSKKGCKNENMVRNKSCFYSVLSKTITTRIYINKTSLNQGCEVRLKQTKLVPTLQFQ